jgi:ligand-binding sensor domain-containing protein/signal transduction histidine kinase
MSFGHFKKWVLASLLTILSPAFFGGVAFALDPKKGITQYVHDVWTTENGLPQNSILSITQTRDGYLWLGTWGGLARFDGVRFTVFERGNTPALNNNYIYALYEGRDGSLWIGTGGGGLTRFRDGKFTTYTTNDGLSINDLRSVCEDDVGNLWIGTMGGGLNRFSDGRFTVFTTRDGLSSNFVYSLYKDRKGSLWAGTSGGLSRFKDGKFITYATKDGLGNYSRQSIAEDRDGRLWFGTLGGLYRLMDGKLTKYPPGDGRSRMRAQSMFEDSDGNLWIGTGGGGLLRFQNGRLKSFSRSDGLSHEIVTSIAEDREGNLWIGTLGGLDRLKDGKFTAFTTKEGLSDDWTRCVYEDREGSLWVGTGEGLNRLRGGHFTHYTMRNGLGNIVFAVYGDRRGNLWCSTVWSATEDGVLSRFKDGIFTHYGKKAYESLERVTAIHEDRRGNLWIGTLGSGLKLLRDGKFTVYSTKDRLPRGKITAINDDQQGNLWIGTEEGLNKFRDGKFTTYSLKNEPFHITSIYEERGGVIWVTTRGQGLVRFKDEELTVFTTREGMFDNVLTTVLEDGRGNFWLGSFRGIFRVRKDELDDVVQKKRSAVTSIVYGKADGMRNVECNSDSPSGWKGRDGRLWFPTVKGLVVIDPDHLKLNTLPPPVYVEQILVGNTPVDSQAKVEVRPGQGDLEIHYTGLSFVAPQKVRFQYKLEGYNKDWVDVGTRRVAYYTNIAPGSYTFRVKASNNDGVWSTQDASIQITVVPPFWRTWWFETLMIVAAILAVVVIVAWFAILIHKRRIAQLRREHAAQKEFSTQLIKSQEAERKRIASELHDSLGQGLLVVKNSALIGLNMSPDGSVAKKQFDEISTKTSEALEEVREITHNLRPYHLDQLGLREALDFMIEKVASSSEIRFSAEIDEIDGTFSKEAEMNLYRIVQESINNIVKHSCATKAKVVLKRDGRQVRLVIGDNGKGFVSDPGARPGPRVSGFGLTGISERVRMLGGKEVIHSIRGQGTTITVMLPAGGLEDRRHAD